MNSEDDTGQPSDPGSLDDPPELLEVQAAVQRFAAARAEADATETDLVRLVAAAKGAGLPDQVICDRLVALGVVAEDLPRALRVVLGYTGPSEG